MTRHTLALIALLAGLCSACAAAAHGSQPARRLLPQAPAADQAVMVIPDNTLTGHGALATPDGLMHF
jgi:hypothetical protein